MIKNRKLLQYVQANPNNSGATMLGSDSKYNCASRSEEDIPSIKGDSGKEVERVMSSLRKA